MFRRLLLSLLTVVVLVGVGLYVLEFWPLRDPHPAPYMARGELALKGARIYVSPDAPPMENATVLVRDGRIQSVGAIQESPETPQTLGCDTCVVTAGFWNAHVHFTEPKWTNAAFKPAALLNAQLADMLVSRGFTTVVDTGSDLRTTISVRRRIESGELLGPKIYTAGSPLYPSNGIPYYLKKSLPPYILWLMYQPKTPQRAEDDVRRNMREGADILKLFTGSYVARGTVLPMDPAIARTAVELAHAHGQLAFSHESNLQGLKVARDSGVDVLAHAADTTEGIDSALLATVVARHMAMIPTLKMFATTVTTNPHYLQPIYDEVREFHRLGGEIIFGSDVGYMTDYRTEDEFRAMQVSGLGWKDILAALTTVPSARFGVSQDKGTIAPGKLGDLVVLDCDPAQDVTCFAKVRTVVRSGRVIFTYK